MKDAVFLEKLKFAASQPSVYLWGTFGMKLTDGLITQKAAQYPGRYSKQRQEYLRSLTGDFFWAWDCTGLVKGILWGWTGDRSLPFGGAVYEKDGIPDVTASGWKRYCTDLSADFTSLIPGEMVFLPGHMGVYIGDGTVIEATLGNGSDGVVYSALSVRGWTEHGKCNFIEYTKEAESVTPWLHVEKIGLYLRDRLIFNGRNKASGTILAFCPVGKEMEILEFIPGLQADGYQWLRTRYNGVEGYSQLDSECYYIFNK